ncbi:MAG: hypothetical protein JXA41_00195 [Deltaproteobacteria bacterium]|nr:hypothetical protein [Deltaproteobacteria bacterium]
MLLVVYNEVADEDLLATLKKAGITAYTKTSEVGGEGSETEPKSGMHDWPGRNDVLFTVIQNGEISIIHKALSVFKKDQPKSGIRSFILPAEEQIL